MPSRTKLKNAAIAARSAALPKIPNELIDQFVTGPMTGETASVVRRKRTPAAVDKSHKRLEHENSDSPGRSAYLPGPLPKWTLAPE